jgi:hypothetical protein
VPIPSF